MIWNILESKEFVIAVVGAVLGGLLTLLGSIIVFMLQWLAERRQEKNKIKNVRNAIHAEITTIWEDYQTRGVGNILNNRVSTANLLSQLCLVLPVSTSIYEGNSSIIANLGNKEFVGKIIQFYSKIKNINEIANTIIIENQKPRNPDQNHPIFKLIGQLNEEHKSFNKEVDDLLNLFKSFETPLKNPLLERLKSFFNFSEPECEKN